jgi:hypothetical protein
MAASAIHGGAAAAPGGSAPLQRLAQCRSIGDDRERVACYDREMAALDAAGMVAAGEAPARRPAAERPRGGFAGMRAPGTRVQTGDGGATVRELTTSIRSVSRGEGGGIVFTTVDGSVWSQTDEWTVAVPIKAGQAVTIRRGAVGTFFARFGKGPSIRVKRLR